MQKDVLHGPKRTSVHDCTPPPLLCKQTSAKFSKGVETQGHSVCAGCAWHTTDHVLQKKKPTPAPQYATIQNIILISFLTYHSVACILHKSRCNYNYTHIVTPKLTTPVDCTKLQTTLSDHWNRQKHGSENSPKVQNEELLYQDKCVLAQGGYLACSFFFVLG